MFRKVPNYIKNARRHEELHQFSDAIVRYRQAITYCEKMEIMQLLFTMEAKKRSRIVPGSRGEIEMSSHLREQFQKRGVPGSCVRRTAGAQKNRRGKRALLETRMSQQVSQATRHLQHLAVAYSHLCNLYIRIYMPARQADAVQNIGWFGCLWQFGIYLWNCTFGKGQSDHIVGQRYFEQQNWPKAITCFKRVVARVEGVFLLNKLSGVILRAPDDGWQLDENFNYILHINKLCNTVEADGIRVNFDEVELLAYLQQVCHHLFASDANLLIRIIDNNCLVISISDFPAQQLFTEATEELTNLLRGSSKWRQLERQRSELIDEIERQQFALNTFKQQLSEELQKYSRQAKFWHRSAIAINRTVTSAFQDERIIAVCLLIVTLADQACSMVDGMQSKCDIVQEQNYSVQSTEILNQLEKDLAEQNELLIQQKNEFVSQFKELQENLRSELLQLHREITDAQNIPTMLDKFERQIELAQQKLAETDDFSDAVVIQCRSEAEKCYKKIRELAKKLQKDLEKISEADVEVLLNTSFNAFKKRLQALCHNYKIFRAHRASISELENLGGQLHAHLEYLDQLIAKAAEELPNLLRDLPAVHHGSPRGESDSPREPRRDPGVQSFEGAVPEARSTGELRTQDGRGPEKPSREASPVGDSDVSTGIPSSATPTEQSYQQMISRLRTSPQYIRDALTIMRSFEDGYRIILVGGTVLSYYLNELNPIIYDFDFVTTAPKEKIDQTLSQHSYKFYKDNSYGNILAYTYMSCDGCRKPIHVVVKTEEGFERYITQVGWRLNIDIIYMTSTGEMFVLDQHIIDILKEHRCIITTGRSIETFINNPAAILRAIRVSLQHGLLISTEIAEFFQNIQLVATLVAYVPIGGKLAELKKFLLRGYAGNALKILRAYNIWGIIFPYYERFISLNLVYYQFFCTKLQQTDQMVVNPSADWKPSFNYVFALCLLPLKLMRPYENSVNIVKSYVGESLDPNHIEFIALKIQVLLDEFSSLSLYLNEVQKQILIASERQGIPESNPAGTPYRFFSPTASKEDDWLLGLTLWLSSIDFNGHTQTRNLFGLGPFDVHFEIGNCLFEAVATFIPGSTGANIRGLAVDHIQRDGQLRRRITALAEYGNTKMRTMHGDITYGSFEEYINYMRQDQTWGTEIELVALARAGRPIVILTPGNLYDQIIPGGDDSHDPNNPIFLNYVGDNHYVPLAVPEGQDVSIILEQIRAAIAQRNQEREARIEAGSACRYTP